MLLQQKAQGVNDNDIHIKESQLPGHEGDKFIADLIVLCLAIEGCVLVLFSLSTPCGLAINFKQFNNFLKIHPLAHCPSGLDFLVWIRSQ